jgi:DNA damage-inducible protein 1
MIMLLVLIVNIKKLDGTERTTIIEIQDNEEVAVLQQMIQFESGLSPAEQVISNNNIPIKDQGLISQAGVQNNANLTVTQIAPRAVKSNVRNTIRKDPTPEELIEYSKSQPHLIDEIAEDDPTFGAAIRAGDVGKLRALMMMRHLKNHEQGFKRQQEQMEIERDPDNPEHQRKIAEAIRMQNVQQNMELAIDELPESFGRIHMLYINITINDTHLKAFVDSGAQSTIMSSACAERVGIMRLLDTRYAGEARGVGTAKILGGLLSILIVHSFLCPALIYNLNTQLKKWVLFNL